MITPSLRCAVVVLCCLSAPVAAVTGTRERVSKTSGLPAARALIASQAHEGLSQSLTPGAPVQRDLPTGQSHRYSVALAGDQYLHVTIEQRGVDIAATLIGPDGTTHADVNLVKGGTGVETLTLISAAAGTYRIDVRAAELSPGTGGYLVTLVDVRSPTAEERTLEEARRLLVESRALRDAGQYAKAVVPAERAADLRERVLGARHLDVAHALHFLAVLYDDLHEYAKAEPLNDRALAIREQALGPDHPDVARSLFNLAWLYKVKQDFARSEAFYRRALAIQERALGPDHSEVATTLNDLAVLYNQRGEYDQSIAINQRVVAIRERTLGLDDPGVAKALNNLARGYELKGDLARAGDSLDRALAIWEKTLGPDHPEVAFAIDGRARIYYSAGDYASAEPLYLRALAIREKTLGPEHTEVATTLNNLALLYRQKGDYTKAEPLVRRDIAITEKRLGPTHSFLAPSLNNLAAIFELQEHYDEAEPLYRRALAIQESAFGSKHPSAGVTRILLGRLYVRSHRDPVQARALLESGVAVLEAAVGPDHPTIPAALTALGRLSERRSEWPQARRLYERALDTQERTLGPDHPEVAQSLEILAALSVRQGDDQQAIARLSRAQDIRERNLSHNLPLGSERQKLGYLKLFADDSDRALSLHAQVAPLDARARDLALTTLLRRKGRALDAAGDNVASLRLHATADEQALFDRLAHARSQLAAVTLRGPSGAGNAYKSLIRQLQDDADRLESEIGARSVAFRAQARWITLESVQSAIPPGTTLVEFAYYRPLNRDGLAGAPRYSAFTVAAHGHPGWVDLGEAEPVERAIVAWRAALADPRRSDAADLARALDARVMEPVRRLLGDTRQILISPDGPLNLIPFAALVDEQRKYLVERYSMAYLTSGRDLLRLQAPHESRSEPTIIAAPAYGEPALLSGNRAASTRVDYSQIFFGPLPGVRDEVRAIQDMLPQATVLVGERATEAALKNVKAPRILHIATHGFFLPESNEATSRMPAPPANGGGTRVGKWVAWTDNPLLRSGLALAGANQGRSGDDDGVLTALEASGLDLWGTKLVVLSACDTGVGDVKRGDGVYGLRRALVLAGAESQLMSLWPVSDRSTRDLMIAYYQQLTQGEGRSDALRQAQLRLLRDGRHAHPYYWASFIQSGEWAPLERRTKP